MAGRPLEDAPALPADAGGVRLALRPWQILTLEADLRGPPSAGGAQR
jgi:hypothetical protein